MEFKEQLKKWRHDLHQIPESAFEEEKTSQYVANELEKMGYKVNRNIGKTGIIATMTLGDSKKSIALRADMDALQMEEKGNPPYKSTHINRMHACGHDGHMATVLGAAKLIAERKKFNGTVVLVFQPAEEPGKGAKAMLDDGMLEKFSIDEIYGLHNMPGIPSGKIFMKAGGIMGSEDNFIIKIKGKGSHSSSPYMGVDPLVVASEIILALQTIVSRNINSNDVAVISCTELHTDGIRNAIPTNVEIKGDTRSFKPEIQKLLETRMKEVCEGVCKVHGAKCEFEYTHEFSPTVNWKECVEVAAQAAENVVGIENVNRNCVPWMASEDFGTFLQKIPGCFVFLGSGKSKNVEENIMLHNSIYDYNDDVLEIGAKYFAEIINLKLS